MGVDFFVIPFDSAEGALDPVLRTTYPWLAKHIAREGGIAQWCAEHNVTLPDGVRSRFPTSRECAATLESLAGLRYEILPGWIRVFTYLDEHEHSYLDGHGFEDGLDDPWPFYFHKGSPDLARFLTSRLAAICGPLLLWPDTGDSLDLITPHLEECAYATTIGCNSRILVRWTDPYPHYTSGQSRLLPFPESDFPDNYQGLPAFLAAHGIAFPDPANPGHLLSEDDLREALSMLHEYHIEWREKPDGLYTDIVDSSGRYVTIRYRWPDDMRFTAGDLLTQLTVAEAIAEHCGPQVLLPSHLSPVSILLQAGDDPAALLAAWETRTAAVAPPTR